VRGDKDGRPGLAAVKAGDNVLNVAAVSVFIAGEPGLNGRIVAETLERLDDAATDDVILLRAAGVRNAVANEAAKNLPCTLGGKFGSGSAGRLGCGRPRRVKQKEENRGEEADDEQRTSSRSLIFLGQPSLRVGDTIGCESAQVNMTPVLLGGERG
jgi:hypothetical protein